MNTRYDPLCGHPLPSGHIYPLCGHPLPSGHPPAPAPSAHTAYGYRTTLFPLPLQWQRLSPVWQTPDATPSTPYPLTYPHPRQTATLPPLPPPPTPYPPPRQSLDSSVLHLPV